MGNGSTTDSHSAAISADGRYVAFMTGAGFVPDDVNGQRDIYVRDRQDGTTELVSMNVAGDPGNWNSYEPAVSGDGRYIAFISAATQLVRDDTNAFHDVFLRDRSGSPDFTPLCEPGVGGVATCPCGNAPSGTGRGCDNSAGTGGAILTAKGGAYLSSDTLVFNASGEKPNATSVLLQGTTSSTAGVVYGQGIRCVGGTLLRLSTMTAHAGSVTAPPPRDPSISARSAALGNPISAGDTRWYLVFYRDPIVLGGCFPASTFNCTETGCVIWSP